MSTTPAKKLELVVERIVMGSRWLQAPLYIGLVVVLGIVTISSIHLLQRFLEAGDYDNGKLYALVVMHMAFVVSALMLTYIDKIDSDNKAAGGH